MEKWKTIFIIIIKIVIKFVTKIPGVVNSILQYVNTFSREQPESMVWATNRGSVEYKRT